MLQTYHLTIKVCCGLRNINKIARLELPRFTVQSWHHIKKFLTGKDEKLTMMRNNM